LLLDVIREAIMDDALKDLWQALVPGLEGAAAGEDGTGIYKHWREHRKRLGSPVGPEHTGGDGKPYQAFASGIIVYWDNGAKEA
jgi:hypothetical protein